MRFYLTICLGVALMILVLPRRDANEGITVTVPKTAGGVNGAIKMSERLLAKLKNLRDNTDQPQQQQDSTNSSTRYADLNPTKHHWYLGACGTVRMNAVWLREWIELMKLSGVSHLFLINDAKPGENDGTDQILAHYENTGYLSIIPGRVPTTLDGCQTNPDDPNGKASNCIAPKYCYQKASEYVDWLLFADSDEFIYPRSGCSVAEHIKSHCNPWATHIRIGWERFGSSGHSLHPTGLLSENFLDSGGECEEEERIADRDKQNNPFMIVGTCVHQKIIYNTKCLTQDHAGWIHWPTNHTAWMRREYPYIQQVGTNRHPTPWQNSGKPVPFKDKQCRFEGYYQTATSCTKWLTEGGGSSDQPQYNQDCCTAGIGYNHYGMRSQEHWQEKLKGVAGEDRGRKFDVSRVDTKSVISFGILKYVKSLRRASMNAGSPVSRRIEFHESNNGQSCFMDGYFRYHAAAEGVASKNVTRGSAKLCCEACLRQGGCTGFSFLSTESHCTMFFSSANTQQRVHEGNRVGPVLAKLNVKGPRKRLIRTVIPGTREADFRYTSGIALREPQCGA
eukprot:TRINITY_DN37274_c0_g1_i1.p1 TRINITY_DN37274_c0_g1~~TRINITY_DN37274_c0_g1_i1.p1  ORF type:complete len:563 (+),score=28.85 TRINITY_DN37274_c0_g1_i1:57-1745(+)